MSRWHTADVGFSSGMATVARKPERSTCPECRVPMWPVQVDLRTKAYTFGHFWRSASPTEKYTKVSVFVIAFFVIHHRLEGAHLIYGFVSAFHLHKETASFTTRPIVKLHLTVNTAIRAFLTVIPELTAKFVDCPLLESIWVTLCQGFCAR